MLSLIEISPAVLEKKTFKFWQCIFAISLLSPFEKWLGHSFEQTLIAFTDGNFVPSLVEIGPVVLEKNIFNFVNVLSLLRNYQPLEKAEPFI